MTRADWQGIGAIYLPLAAAMFLGLLGPRRPRQLPSCLLSLLWAANSLLAVQKFNDAAGWWTFPSSHVLLCGMPLELLIGWTLLWGILPQLAFPELPLVWPAAIMILLDLLLMPLCGAVVSLGPHWLFGEAIAVLFVLLPALLIARWTLTNTHLRARAAMQVCISTLLFLFFLPEVAFALRPGRDWAPLLNAPSWQRQLELQFILLLGLPGIAAVMEFAQRGQGTPIPYDPPKRLVTSGIYRYCANPMQLSCGMVLFAWAAILQNVWIAGASMVSLIFSAGIAYWDEQQDLAQRFGTDWRLYRASVSNWLPRWRPFHTGSAARLYLDPGCAPCSQLKRWLEDRGPRGLEIIDAGTLPRGSIRRMRYDPNDTSPAVDGIRALGCALEHLHLGWAIAGAALRLPIFWQFIQLVMDASGFGPRLPAQSPANCAVPVATPPTNLGAGLKKLQHLQK